MKAIMELPANTEFNIDTVSFSITNATVNLDNLSPKRQEVTHSGATVYSRTNRAPVYGFESRHNLYVRYRDDLQELSVEGAPYAFLSGQNVYTSPNLRRICVAALKELKTNIGLLPTTAEHGRDWMKGCIDLHRVDIAVNFRFNSDQEVLEVLKQIRRQLVNAHGSMRKVHTTVYWSPKDGKRYQIVAYAKGPQMQVKDNSDMSDDNEAHKRLIQDCSGLLRIELRLMRSELKLLGLDQASAWTKDKVREVFIRYFKRLKILNVLSGPLTTKDLEGVSDRMRPALALLKLGADVEKIYSKRTIENHRKYFRGLDIDVRTPSAPARAVPLLTVLRKAKRAATRPEWLAQPDLPALPGRQRRATRNLDS